VLSKNKQGKAYAALYTCPTSRRRRSKEIELSIFKGAKTQSGKMDNRIYQIVKRETFKSNW
jgi:hypothetical protein